MTPRPRRPGGPGPPAWSGTTVGGRAVLRCRRLSRLGQVDVRRPAGRGADRRPRRSGGTPSHTSRWTASTWPTAAGPARAPATARARRRPSTPRLRRAAAPAAHRATATVYAPAFERDLEQPLAGAIAVPPAGAAGRHRGQLPAPRRTVGGASADCSPRCGSCRWTSETRVRRLVARHEQFGKSHDGAVDWVRTVDQPNADLVAPTAALADLVVELGSEPLVRAGRRRSTSARPRPARSCG